MMVTLVSLLDDNATIQYLASFPKKKMMTMAMLTQLYGVAVEHVFRGDYVTIGYLTSSPRR